MSKIGKLFAIAIPYILNIPRARSTINILTLTRKYNVVPFYKRLISACFFKYPKVQYFYGFESVQNYGYPLFVVSFPTN